MPDPHDRPKVGSGFTSGVDNLTPGERKSFEDRLSKLDAKLDDVQSRRQKAAENPRRQGYALKGHGHGASDVI